MTKVEITHGMNPTREWAIGELRRMVLDAVGEHDAAVWLFGSCARGDVHHPDDIDVAIFPRGDFPSSFFTKLAADFEESTIPDDLDLIDLREADDALRNEILWTGIRWRD
jgi:predicted nucleotidyltransferase